MRPRVSVSAVAALMLLLGGAVALQAARDRMPAPARPHGADAGLLYVQSGAFMQRAALSYDSLAADIYWMRALQHFGRTKLSQDPEKQYNLLFPLLDLTTSLDPRFDIAYRFGAVFLAEAFPGGAGRPDLAIQLLEKGRRANPTRWQYPQDIAFVHYWWRHDYQQAAEWFMRASELPDAPNWLAPMAAVTLTQGGNRESARRLWSEVAQHAEAAWLVEQATFRLTQLEALDQIDALERIVKRYDMLHGTLPDTWEDVVRAGLLRGIPVDPRQFPYALNPYWGTVRLADASTLNPLPTSEGGRQ